MPSRLGSSATVAKEIGRNRGILHQNDGLLTSSQHSIDDAAFCFIALERACKQQLLVEAAASVVVGSIASIPQNLKCPLIYQRSTKRRALELTTAHGRNWPGPP